MTDPNTPGTRDQSGRFVKRAAENLHALNTPSDAGVHPMAKLLFGWTEHRLTGTLLFWLFAILAMGLLAADLFIQREAPFGFANATGFYGLFGFLAFTVVVLAGWPLGWILRRRANFYHPADSVPNHTDPDLESTPPASRNGAAP